MLGEPILIEKNDGTNADDVLNSNDPIPTIESLNWAYSGHIFSHWNTESDNSGISYMPGEYVDSNTYTLYAIWIPFLAQLFSSFDANGPSISIGTAPDGQNGITINDDWQVTEFYPVGSIYITTESYTVSWSDSGTSGTYQEPTNPSIHFGGTWELFGSGRTLLGYTDSAYAEPDIGGDIEHTLTVDEMPYHRHPFAYGKWLYTGTSYARIASSGNGSSTYSTSYTGGGQPHNNCQPYKTVYIWRRTA